MPVRLGDAADRPAEVAQNLPIIHDIRIYRSASGLQIGFQELLKTTHAAHSFGVLPEAPRTHTRPCQLLRRVANVSKFPVKYTTQPVGTDHQISNTKIAMQQYWGLTAG